MPVNKIIVNGQTLIDLSHDTVEKSTLVVDETAHTSIGQQIIGTGVPLDSNGIYVDSDGIAFRIRQNITPVYIRVMTYNTGGWYIGDHTNVPAEKLENYRTLQSHILSMRDPDIAVFQEYWHYFDRNNTIPSRDFLSPYFSEIYEFDSNSKSYGKAMVSKTLPLEDYAHFRFNCYVDHPTYGNEYYYGFERAYINVNGKRICIINTWLDSSDNYWAARKSEVEQLVSYVANEPYFILMGDFNVNPSGTNDQHYIDFIKPFVDAGYNVCNNAMKNGSFAKYWTYYSGTTSQSHEALDQIITSSNIIVDNVYIDTVKLNDTIADRIDHVPFLADLIII